MRLPHAPPSEALDFGILGLPLDAATSFRSGARFGPEAIRSMSALVRRYHPAHDVDLFDHLVGADCGDSLVVPGYVDASYAHIERAVAELQTNGVTSLCLGGDHSVVLPELRAVASVHGPVALILFDAHNDTRDRHMGEPYGHGTVLRRAVEEGLVDVSRSIHVGTRGSVGTGQDLQATLELGYEVVTTEEAREIGMPAVGGRVRDRVGDHRAFLSFDVDVLDPAFAPGTGTPTIGGLTSAEAVQALRSLAGVHIVGMDVVEVAPAYDAAGTTALVGASVVWEVLGLMAVRRRDGGSA
jgi:agmatinase